MSVVTVGTQPPFTLKSITRRNGGPRFSFEAYRMGPKRKRRKAHYLPGWHGHRDGRMLTRRERHITKQELDKLAG